MENNIFSIGQFQEILFDYFILSYQKSHGAMSGEYGAWSMTFGMFLANDDSLDDVLS